MEGYWRPQTERSLSNAAATCEAEARDTSDAKLKNALHVVKRHFQSRAQQVSEQPKPTIVRGGRPEVWKGRRLQTFLNRVERLAEKYGGKREAFRRLSAIYDLSASGLARLYYKKKKVSR